MHLPRELQLPPGFGARSSIALLPSCEKLLRACLGAELSTNGDCNPTVLHPIRVTCRLRREKAL